MIRLKKLFVSKCILLGLTFALTSCAANTAVAKEENTPSESNKIVDKSMPIEKQETSTAHSQTKDPTIDGKEIAKSDDLGSWDPKIEDKDCRKDQQIIFNNDAFVRCIEGLDEFEAQMFLREAFWSDTLWLKTLETRKSAWLHLKKNRRQDEAKYLMEQLLNLFSQVDPYKQEVLVWLEAESQAQKSRIEMWNNKFHELENSLRLGNSRPQLEARIEGLDRGLLNVEETVRLDSLLNKAQSIDSLRLSQKWQVWTQSEKEKERELAKQVMLEKYTYLLSPAQAASLNSGVKPQDDFEAQCEEKRSKAAEYVADSKTIPQRKRELLNKAASELTECIEILPEGDYKDKVRTELRKVRRWM